MKKIILIFGAIITLMLVMGCARELSPRADTLEEGGKEIGQELIDIEKDAMDDTSDTEADAAGAADAEDSETYTGGAIFGVKHGPDSSNLLLALCLQMDGNPVSGATGTFSVGGEFNNKITTDKTGNDGCAMGSGMIYSYGKYSGSLDFVTLSSGRHIEGTWEGTANVGSEDKPIDYAKISLGIRFN